MLRAALERLRRTLIEPPAHIDDVAFRHTSRLLNIFLLIMIFTFMIVDGVYFMTISNYTPPWYGYVFLGASYFLNHSRYFRAAAFLTLVMFPLVIVINFVVGGGTFPQTTLYFLIAGLILGEILLSFWFTALFAVVEIIVILSMPYIAPHRFAGLSDIVGPFSALLISAGLVLFSMRHRDRVEADRQELLRKSEERYRLVSSVISDYTFSNVRNEKGDIVLDWVAGAFEQISGYSVEEFNALGGWIPTVHPDDLGKDARDMELLFKNQRVVTELRTIHKDGSIRWVRSYAHPVWDDEKNELGGIYGAVQDITEQKRIERERESLIAELERKNAELEQFAYTVSHDLKAPIITIKGFLGFLAEDAFTGNIERLQQDIKRIAEATNKMHKLLNDLLELSRIGRLMGAPEKIPFGALLRDALELIQGSLMERKIKVVVADGLPDVYGDRQRLLEVLQNLLDNAVKFMGDQPNPIIEIGRKGDEKDGLTTCFVRDNGMGIALPFHERIFGLFNRLNPQIEGTGVGLALVKRIVEFHGGRVWVQSEAGGGATFYFTLPQPPRSE